MSCRRRFVRCVLHGPLLFMPFAAHADSDLAVVRVGDGSAALSAAATRVYIERRAGADGSLVAAANNPLQLPTTASGLNARLTLAGSATSEGAIARSADARYLTLAGYDAAVGTASVAGTASSTVNRVAGRIDWNGNVDTSTLLNVAFSAGNVRSAVSADGAGFWVGGAGTGGGWYVTLGALGGTQVLSNPSNTRVLNIFAGQLFGTSASGSFVNVFTIGTGLPTMAGQTATSLPGFPTSGTASPYAFVFFDRSNTVAGLDTLYVADDRSTASGGGIQKWTFDGSNWTLAITFIGGLGTGVRGLAGEVSDANVVLYATTTEGSANKLVRLVDDGTPSPSAVILSTAATDTVFRGVALWPDVIYSDGFE
jgi:hypothetical protein